MATRVSASDHFVWKEPCRPFDTARELNYLILVQSEMKIKICPFSIRRFSLKDPSCGRRGHSGDECHFGCHFAGTSDDFGPRDGSPSPNLLS